MDSIIEALSGFFSPKFHKKLKRCENLTLLIAKLEKKEKSITEKLATELTETQRDCLTTKLAVLKVQKEKAQLLLSESQQN